MGGTSFDMSLITKGEINYTIKSYHSRHAVATPMIDIQSIGAGGGSIAYLEDGIMKVGPQSAGADPGPICYEKGGEYPTVTDANLLLGRLDASRFLGGNMVLNTQKAQEAMNAFAYYIRGLIHFDLGEVQNAIEDLERSLELGLEGEAKDIAEATLVELR